MTINAPQAAARIREALEAGPTTDQTSSQVQAKVALPTNEEIEMFAAKMVREQDLLWLGFRQDAGGRFTIPVVSQSVCDLLRAAIAQDRAFTHHRAARAQAEPVKLREEFEAYIRKDCGDLSTFGSGQNMHYSNGYVNNAWLGWQARARLAAPSIPQATTPPVQGDQPTPAGYVLVPREPELASSEVNDACWAWIEAMPHTYSAAVWNDLKPAVHAAITKFIWAVENDPYPAAAPQPLAASEAEPEAPTESFYGGVEFLAARVRRVCGLVGVPLPGSGGDSVVAECAGTLLGSVAYGIQRANVALANSVGLSVADLAKG